MILWIHCSTKKMLRVSKEGSKGERGDAADLWDNRLCTLFLCECLWNKFRGKAQTLPLFGWFESKSAHSFNFKGATLLIHLIAYYYCRGMSCQASKWHLISTIPAEVILRLYDLWHWDMRYRRIPQIRGCKMTSFEITRPIITTMSLWLSGVVAVLQPNSKTILLRSKWLLTKWNVGKN